MQNHGGMSQPAGSWKKVGKSLLGYMAYSIGLHRILFRRKAVVVAFHRISDSPDGGALNCPADVFAGLCEFFRKRFSVIPLSELIERLGQNEPIDHMLSITFDDGYKDNFEVAAPILRRFELPATFFIATSYIGSSVIPFWDADAGVRSEWMTWDDVRKLEKMGFDIGGHTMNHADLASVSEEEAKREIDGCRQVLLESLNSDIPNFAYPFGGVGNITPAATELVAASGFSCCLSCHGGIISAGDSVFELKREPINNWVASSYQYGFELLTKALEAGR